MKSDVELFLRKRDEETHWRHTNGYDNGDPITNGEFLTVDLLKDQFDVFIDIGANRGEFSTRVLKNSKNVSVFAFEANPDLAGQLSRQLGERSKVYGVGISNQAGEAHLKVHPKDLTTSSLYERTEMMATYASSMQSFSIKLSTLDNYIGEIKPNCQKGTFIKVDVEGGEYPALLGSTQFFQLPTALFVMFEYSFGWKEAKQDLKSAFHFLDSNGCEIYRITPLGLERIKFFSLDMDNFSYCNYLAVRKFNMSELLEGHPIAGTQGNSTFYSFRND
jgi:FkbM family methyltransferase